MAPYKPTLFDRHGPDAGQFLRAWGYGLLVFGLVSGTLFARIGFRWWVLPIGALFGAVAGGSGWLIGTVFGDAWKHVAVDGASTPYEPQFSYEQALVMQGRLDEALASFEAIIAAEPESVAPRVKAAELYARDKKDHARAAELFREILALPTIRTGDDVYAANRLVDLYLGPLNDPGRAMAELRRLIDRRPATAAAEHARRSLADLKTRVDVRSVEE